MGGYGKAIIAGVIGGVVSAGIWTAIAYFTGYEIGWIAWLVGVVVGFCVRVAAGNSEGIGLGVIAVVIAVLALLGGKYATVRLIVNDAFGDGMAQMMNVSDDDMLLPICKEVAGEWSGDKKKKLKWPPGKSVENAEELIDFPHTVLDEAKKRWETKPAEERVRLKTEIQEERKEFAKLFSGMAAEEGFKASFNGYDILFFFLAIASAFRVGSGMSSGD